MSERHIQLAKNSNVGVMPTTDRLMRGEIALNDNRQAPMLLALMSEDASGNTEVRQINGVGRYQFHKVAPTSTTYNVGEVFNSSENIASGVSSHAEGERTRAEGYGSHAEGLTSNAQGQASHAEGYNTRASGLYGPHAEGWGTIAVGNASHAEGSITVASEESSHAEG